MSEQQLPPMTLRQWYAGQVIVGLMSDSDFALGNPEALAAVAFRVAASMIEESKQEYNRD